MKKLLKLSLVGIMMMSLVGCGSKGKKADETTKEITPKPTQQVEDVNENVDPMPEGDSGENVVIVIDAGHGGGFSGAAYGDFVEKDLTLKVATNIKSYLEENYTGIEVYLSREKDSALSGDVAEDLEMRAEYAKSVEADALVSIHFNASDAHNTEGAMVCISHQKNVTEVCDALGNSILKELNSLGIKNNGTLTRNSNDMFDEDGKPLDYYAINRHCAKRDIPGIIVEHCYMDNANDQAYIDSEDDLMNLAKADADGIANYFGLASTK